MITPITFIPLLQSKFIANGLAGPSNIQLATGIANGFCSYVQTGITAKSIDAGSAGAGTGIGFGINLAFLVLSGSFQLSFTPFTGPMKMNLITALSDAFSQVLLSANINTINTGVGTGGGTVSLNPNPLVSVLAMTTNLSGFGMVGSQGVVLATAIAQGIDQALPSATGIINIVGTASPYAAVGVGIGKIS